MTLYSLKYFEHIQTSVFSICMLNLMYVMRDICWSKTTVLMYNLYLFAVVGSFVSSFSGAIRWMLLVHCRREVESRTMLLMDLGCRRESWKIFTVNDSASCKKREFTQSVFLFYTFYSLYCLPV